ncbi:hypothetical protein SAMN05192552_10993 [Natrinema hispanicum]|uniref:Uncharacterized protein n=1 Tax=Natrinema hispanicum TaxID=392421 RepID=A0A1I0JWF4_9EURY|nr:hypothetical protein SAMN05192552_10993 [Natrinema hispanicum]SEU14260.1 hypothetical protein SAMN04488694_1654 [Natrinema hispanicum]
MIPTIPPTDAVPPYSRSGLTAFTPESQDALAEQLPSTETAFGQQLGMEFNDSIRATAADVTLEQLFESLRTDICTNEHGYLTSVDRIIAGML